MKRGDWIYWKDPDNQVCAGYYRYLCGQGEHVYLFNGVTNFVVPESELGDPDPFQLAEQQVADWRLEDLQEFCIDRLATDLYSEPEELQERLQELLALAKDQHQEGTTP